MLLLYRFARYHGAQLSRSAHDLERVEEEGHGLDVLAERVLAGEGEGLDAGEALVVQERDEGLAARVGAQDVCRGRAADRVRGTVDERAMEDEAFVVVVGDVLEAGDTCLPCRGVQGADSELVCGVDEVHGVELLLALEAVGRKDEARVLGVGGRGEGHGWWMARAE